MRDVIQGLVAAEAEAKQLIQSARDEAGRVVQEAQKRAQDLAARMRAETRADVEKILQGAVAEAQGIKEQRLLKARSEIAGRMQLDAGQRRPSFRR